MEALEYITKDGLLQCTEGSAPGIFTPTYNTTVKINGCVAATKVDMAPLTNVPSFVICKKTQKTCTPVTTPWLDTYPVKVKGQETLIGKSCINCGVGGKIEFIMSGQIPLDADEKAQLQAARDDVQKAHDEEMEEKNKPWWQKAGEFIVDCVPVVGPIVSLVKNVSKGNWGMALLDVGFLALDVASIVAAPFTGGASVVGATAAKVGIRQMVKAGVKQVAKKLSKEALEAAAKQTAEMLSKLSVKSLTRGRLCVFACFPAGTPVATKDGLRNIEEIKVGDEVWAYNETNGAIGLKPVVNTFNRTTDLLVNIEIDGEIITATPEHPFYANGDWKAAGLLETGDNILLFSGKLVKVKEVKYEGAHAPVEIDNNSFEASEIIDENTTKVFNFEVEGWHTYFVGLCKYLVHNSQVCFTTMILQSQKWFQNIMRGNSFNMVMNNALSYLYTKKGLKYLDEVYVALKNGKNGRIDGFIKGKAIIERKATNLVKVSEKTAKSYIDNAAKYKNAMLEGKTLKEPIFLQVENMQGVSKEVLDYATKKGVTIIDDITKLPGL